MTVAAAMPDSRLRRWLTDGPIQRDDGAVAGYVDDRDNAAYVYPEITGYYLQWLAWNAARGEPRAVLAARAAAAQRWLTAWIAETPPVTRVFRDPARMDWRNRAVFCFDLAMVLRGLAAATRYELVAPVPGLVAAVCQPLVELIGADHLLDACKLHDPRKVYDPHGDFPDRWSTRRGAFLAKAAAGIEFAAAVLDAVPAALRDAATRTFAASLDALGEPHLPTHPLLYAIEGYLNWPTHPDFAARLPAIGARFDALVERSTALGRVPEAMDAPGAARLDIVAQTLRAGLLLAQHRGAAMPDAFRRKLEAALRAAATPDGAIPFVRDARPPQRNAWATMFASQALAWSTLDADAMAQLAAEPLIV
ncbi:MAG: hypothetical protein ABI812_05750 [Betaproteobacteria bacterium]